MKKRAVATCLDFQRAGEAAISPALRIACGRQRRDDPTLKPDATGMLATKRMHATAGVDGLIAASSIS